MNANTNSVHQLCECGACQGAVRCRPRYYARQHVTPAVLTLEADYFRHKLRMHNRMLHGWGVVCGAEVCRVPTAADPKQHEPWQVVIKPGYILGPCGDEIEVCCDQIVDLTSTPVTGTGGDCCGETAEVWCRGPRRNLARRAVLYVAIKYQELMTRPVRVSPAGCGCADNPCEFSQWCDSYEIGLLDECPDAGAKPTFDPANPTFNPKLFPTGCPECPECPSSPWVVLAKVEIEASGEVRKPDNCDCRRLVFPLGRLWTRCR